MDIQISNDKRMHAVLINHDDDLHAVIDDTTFGNASQCREYTATVSQLSDNLVHGSHGFRISLVENLDSRDIDLERIHPTNDDGLYSIDTANLMHAVNMLKGFFASNKYREYVTSHSKRTKLISKKRKLGREINKIDRELN